MPRLALVLPCLFVSATAFAQAADSFRPAMDARGYLSLDGSQTLGHEELSFGLGSLDWGHRITGQVDDFVSATLVAALGLDAFGLPIEFGASLPVSIASGTTDGQGLGDAGLHLKVRIAHAGPIGFGAIASVYVPTSSSAMFGDSGVTPELVGIADTQLGRWRLAINGGVRRGTLAMDAMPTTQFPAGVAAAWAVVPDKFEVVGEVFGAPTEANHGYQQLQAMGGVKLYLAKNSYLALGAGRGLASDATASGTPDFRAMIGIVFEPKPASQTRTVIPDVPDEPVHARVAEDEPPPPPVIDYSPIVPDTTPGCTHSGPTDDTDCPDREAVKVGKTEIVILKSIEFEFDKAVIQHRSYPILDAVAQALKDNPDIQVVEVGGHTDERGDDAYNLDLSQRRADAVVKYLVDKGIDADRLGAQGYGETMPLDPAHNEAAWTKNRRVEFKIRKRNGEIL
jgi:outer membrane protein OmpA-like peptidoglycan-associated protein